MSCQVNFSGHKSSKYLKKHISIFPLHHLAQQLFLWKCVIPDFPAVAVWEGHQGLKPFTQPGLEKLFCYFLQYAELLTPGCQPSAYSDKGLLCKVSCSSSTLVPLLPVCWSCLAPCSERHPSCQLPHPSLPWFYKWHLIKCPILIFMFNSSSLDKQGSSWELPSTSPECSFLIHSMSFNTRQTEERKKCLPKYCYARFIVLPSMYLLDQQPEQQGAI